MRHRHYWRVEEVVKTELYDGETEELPSEVILACECGKRVHL